MSPCTVKTQQNKICPAILLPQSSRSNGHLTERHSSKNDLLIASKVTSSTVIELCRSWKPGIQHPASIIGFAPVKITPLHAQPHRNCHSLFNWCWQSDCCLTVEVILNCLIALILKSSVPNTFIPVRKISFQMLHFNSLFSSFMARLPAQGSAATQVQDVDIESGTAISSGPHEVNLHPKPKGKLSKIAEYCRRAINNGREECIWLCIHRNGRYIVRDIPLTTNGYAISLYDVRKRCNWWKRHSLYSAVGVREVEVCTYCITHFPVSKYWKAHHRFVSFTLMERTTKSQLRMLSLTTTTVLPD